MQQITGKITRMKQRIVLEAMHRRGIGNPGRKLLTPQVVQQGAYSACILCITAGDKYKLQHCTHRQPFPKGLQTFLQSTHGLPAGQIYPEPGAQGPEISQNVI